MRPIQRFDSNSIPRHREGKEKGKNEEQTSWPKKKNKKKMEVSGIKIKSIFTKDSLKKKRKKKEGQQLEFVLNISSSGLSQEKECLTCSMK